MDKRLTGWLPDKPDINDYSLKTDQINALVRQIQILRGFDSFLESLEATSNPLSGTPLARVGKSFQNIPIKVKGVKIPLREAISYLRKDVEIISRGLTAGIDLIGVSPNPNAKKSDSLIPLIPPISPKAFDLFIENKIINTDNSNEKKFSKYNEEDLIKARQVLHQMAPMAKHGRGLALEQKVEELSNQSSFESDLSFKTLRPENIIEINPVTMYNLLNKEGLPKAGIAGSSPSDTQHGENSVDKVPPLRIPLNGNLSSQLREKSVQNYILPDIVDLSYWCSPVKLQKEFNSCTSHAVAALVEYFQNRLADRPTSDFTPVSLSARFLYKVTRHLRKQEEADRRKLKEILKDGLLAEEVDVDQRSEALLNTLDDLSLNFLEQRRKIVENIKEEKINEFLVAMFDVGASIRQTLKALQLFGAPLERYWPYDVDILDFNDEPPPFCYAFAQSYQTIKYFRLDSLDLDNGNGVEGEAKKEDLILTQIKAVLAAGFPAVCGFLYEFGNNDESGRVLLPAEEIITAFSKFKANPNQKINNDGIEIFGHAVLVVGYSDVKEAFLFQNSYGKDWGDEGYGWLPYEFVMKGLATDWWSLLNSEWVEVGDFGLDSSWGAKLPKGPPKN
ncbi:MULTISPECIES: C1 family peptidase [Cyanophyceae]|uniref:C1 family peptidase n=1 Tax=Leptolyngbya subtilissima DQ-A4 TaxID=2933933 RepID=A0ABV0K911_9CYAN|nr:C1 family peptidase [Nodosilinea sp. FACHB-141]MBD2114172.1 C1 family peptidase [Nodosilinea sp. FACHB-141]